MTRFRLALRLLRRDGRSGELTLLVLALLVAVAGSTTISLFADRLQRTLTLQAGEFLAGDMVISGSAAIEPAWLEQARALPLEQSRTVEFSSVLLEHEEMLLASIKAVSQGYPLRGFLKVRQAEPAEDEQVGHGPEPGSAWVEKRVLSALNLKLGDTLTVGEKPLRITRVLTYEPDKRGDFYSFSPRVMINLADLQATGVVQPGSQVRYFYQFAGAGTQLTAFKQALKAQLNPSQRILDVHEDRPELGSALQRAERYLGLSSIVVVLIAGVAIAMAAGRYTERHYNAAALLRCLGCRQSEIVRLYVYQFMALGILASAAGCLLGWLGQMGLFYILGPLLPTRLADPGVWAVVLGFATGMAILLGFALPPLLRLRRVSPLRVLRRELAPLPTRAWLIYGLAISVVTAMIWRYSNDWQMTAAILGGGILVSAALAMLTAGCLSLAGKYLASLSVTWRFGMQGLIRHRRVAISQIMAFSITLAAMSLSFSVRNGLIEQWRGQLPEQAPNHFALNIIPEQLASFEQELRQNGVSSSRFYPIVRGRLVGINEEDVRKRVSKDSRGEAATQRDLSLTWARMLPEDNVIVAGENWRDDQSGRVSVEQKLAENLGIEVGDRLLFTVGSTQVSATVSNLRSLQWDTMKPNFYMIFSPGTLEGFPTTYLTSFYLTDEQKSLLNKLVKHYPAVTILEVDQILKQLQTILKQLSKATDLLLYFALSAGFLVMFAAVYASLDQRIQEGVLMRTLGARRGWLRKTHIIEFGLLGILSGFLAAVIAQAILYVLYSHVMHIPFHWSVLDWVLLPAIGGVSVGLAGYWGMTAVVNRSPMWVLRRL